MVAWQSVWGQVPIGIEMTPYFSARSEAPRTELSTIVACPLPHDAQGRLRPLDVAVAGVVADGASAGFEGWGMGSAMTLQGRGKRKKGRGN
jgi:hypothetical protein